ncbi:MAG: hypothetical protein WEB58_16025 [Planctomycetaceae bacterium]
MADTREIHRTIWSELPLFAGILTGIVLAIVQFAINRSVWSDEAAVALNIVTKSYPELLRPLDHQQVAPIGFLFLERFFFQEIIGNELGLRILPLLGFLASIPLTYFLSLRLFADRRIALFATSFFTLSLQLIRYSSEVKQYSTDVAVGLLIACLSLYLPMRKPSSVVAFGVAGSLLIWMSNVSVILLFSFGSFILFEEVVRRNNYRVLFAVLLWIASFVTYYQFFIHDHPSREFMLRYWGNSFLPLNPFDKEFYFFVKHMLMSLFGFAIGFGGLWILPFLFFTFTTVMLARQKRFFPLYICISPIVVHLILSSFRLYPFSGRLVLYLAPYAIILYSYSLWMIWEKLTGRIISTNNYTQMLPVLAMFIPIFFNFPVYREELRPNIEFVHKRREPGEMVYLYYGATPAYSFYDTVHDSGFGRNLVLGNAHRKSPAEYGAEVDELTGRYWLLFSHVYPHATIRNSDSEEVQILEHITSNGGKILDKNITVGSAVYYIEMTKR